jgi:hypothetical protein
LGQKIGKCEEAVGVAVADTVVILALEHQVNIYTAENTTDLNSWFTNRRALISFGQGELGKPFLFKSKELIKPNSAGAQSSNSGKSTEAELRLSHYFAPVDLISSISYNPRGKIS